MRHILEFKTNETNISLFLDGEPCNEFICRDNYVSYIDEFVYVNGIGVNVYEKTGYFTDELFEKFYDMDSKSDFQYVRFSDFGKHIRKMFNHIKWYTHKKEDLFV